MLFYRAPEHPAVNMSDSDRNILLCTCADTMQIDDAGIRRACRGTLVLTAHQLCRGELERFRTAARNPAALSVGCTQEAALFSATAAEAGRTEPISFVNVRERAGWSLQAAAAGPKMAALLAAAAEPVPQPPWITLESHGVVLIYGRDEQAVTAGDWLKPHLDVTVLIKPPADLMPRCTTEFPVAQGTVRSAKGHLGAFEVVVDDFAQASPSSRSSLAFGPTRDRAVSRCDIFIDVSGDSPLFPGSDLREGYLRGDPANPAAVLELVLKARDLVGTFDKPRYIAFSAPLCATVCFPAASAK